MTPRKAWLLWSAVAAVVVYLLMWIGYVLQWNWLATIDSASLEARHRHGVAHPAWVTSWNRVFRGVPVGGASDGHRHGSGRNTGSTRYRTLKVASVHSVPTSPSRASSVGPSTAVKLNSGTLSS